VKTRSISSILVVVFCITFVTSKAQVTHEILRLNNGQANHKGILEFGLSDVVFENSPPGSGYYGDLLIKTWGQPGQYGNTLMLKGNGNVGVGTINPDSRLTVNGRIKCEEVVVIVDVPADYVFNLDYKLMPLSEVGKYIKENKHLPNVPSAEEIKQNGWQVGEMNNKLLEKVEELTLYLLELKNENEALKARVEALESQKR
jgi:hypothetical protein